MKLKFQVQYPDLIGNNICGEALNHCNPANATIHMSSPYGDCVGTSSVPVTFASLTGFESNFQVENNKGVVLDATLEYDSLGSNEFIIKLLPDNNNDNIWEYVELYININYPNHHSYTNVFKIYNYDLGYTTVNANDYPFGIVMIRDNYGIAPLHVHLAYSSFIAYRVPFTDKIRIYNNNSTVLDNCFYRDQDGNMILNARDGYICNSETVEIHQYCDVQGTTCHTSLVIPSIQWMPDYQLEIDCNANCSSECISTIESTTQALADINFTNNPLFLINGINVPIIRNLEIKYQIIDYTGTIISIFDGIYNRYNANSGLLAYNSADFLYTFLTPLVGDYAVKLCLNVIGEFAVIINSGIPVLNEYYQIVNNLNADFTPSGAANNTIGTVFQANGIIPIYGTDGRLIPIFNSGVLLVGSTYIIMSKGLNDDFSNCSVPITNENVGTSFITITDTPTAWGNPATELTLVRGVYQCCNIQTISSCDVFQITQLTCSQYQINNLSINTFEVFISLMDDTGVFNELSSVEILGLDSTVITLANQGIYTFSTTINGVINTHIVINTCEIDTCLLAKIKDLNCTCSVPCKDKEMYEFNAFMLQWYVYMNLVNKYMNVNYVYTVLDSLQLADLYKMSQIITRFAEYCNTCNKPCNCE